MRLAKSRVKSQNEPMNHQRVKNLVAAGLIGFVMLITGLVLWSWPEPSRPSATNAIRLLHQSAPGTSFSLLEAQEKQQSPADWRGQPVFVNFFASWCARCRGEHPLFTDLRAAVTTPIIGIAYYDRASNAQNYLAEHGNPYTTVLWDKTGSGGRSWGVDAVPQSFVLDAAGTVMWHHRGPISATMLQSEIVPLLQKLAVPPTTPDSAQQ